ncbi:phosphotransferase family protein [Salinisphaera aquimarina]|uniref:Phosphotransferase family protein n=1 Tax=Salinisphaera aquimarina TaxID=2094031 RepID=A0ABV7EMB6_9GAMM
MSAIDQAKDIREGEDIDAAALTAYCREHAPELVPADGDIVIRQFPGGASNLTYLLRVDDAEYVLRRPPFGSQVKSAHDMGREYGVLSRLHGVYDYAPKPIVHCTDDDVIGAEFYVMQRLRGVILRRDLPDSVTLSPAEATRMCEQLLDVQATLHTTDIHAAGMADFGKPEGYIERQVTGWNTRYRNARTDDVPDCEAIMTWLESRIPNVTRAAIIHNDYKLDNVVFDEGLGHIIGVLDWEMATLGDPVMDFGCSMAYWVQADDPEDMQQIRMGPTHLPGMLTREQMIDRYRQATGESIDDWPFYQAFGLFRLAAILQQIYKRFVEGKTRDKRFESFGTSVAVLAAQCERVIAAA